MSAGSDWNVDSYREDYESDEHWGLRKAFMVRWKDDYPEDRLVCLARVFANIELMGCRYPPEVMKEVALRSEDIAKSYRQSRKGMLQRTFVSASDAAEDRAKGIKREAGVVQSHPPNKSARIEFVPQGHVTESSEKQSETRDNPKQSVDNDMQETEIPKSNTLDIDNYFEEMKQIKVLDVRKFTESMFATPFGKFVLVVRPWSRKFENINASCANCGVPVSNSFADGLYRLMINNVLVAEAQGFSKADARTTVEDLAWKRLRSSCVLLLVKQQWVSHGARVTGGDLGAASERRFESPVQSSVADKMMKLMGWSGGGLGAGSQGIEEPIKPHLQIVARAGLGADKDLRAFEHSCSSLLERHSASAHDEELVFSSEFSKEERAVLHRVARRMRMPAKSYGKEPDRFLVVSKQKKDPFSLVLDVVRQGGETEKHRVLLPIGLAR